MTLSRHFASSQKPRSRKYVAIAGTIGAGKTTLAQLLQHHLGWQPYLEGQVHRDNEFFRDAYGDFGRWGFHHQVYYLTASAERHKLLAGILTKPSNGLAPDVIVEDRTPFDHTDGYLQAYAMLKRISVREVELLERLTKALEPYYVVPDLLVFRQLSSHELLRRVQQRRRPHEELVDYELLEAISRSFDELAHTWTRSPILILDPEVNILERSQAAAVAKDVKAALEAAARAPTSVNLELP